MGTQEIINSNETYKAFFENPFLSVTDGIQRHQENCFGFDNIKQANLWTLFVLSNTMRDEHKNRFKKEDISVERLKSAFVYKMSFTQQIEMESYVRSEAFEKLKEFIAWELFWRCKV